MEGRIALRQERRLAVDFPAVGFGIGWRHLRIVGGRARPIDLAVQANTERLEVQTRRVLRARREVDVGPFEPAVEIFQTDTPVRRKGIFDAAACAPTETCIENLVVIADRGRIAKTFAGPG